MNKVEDSKVYWYTTKDILAELKRRGLPSTWAQFKAWDDAGRLPTFKNWVLFHKSDTPTTKGDRVGVVISKRLHPIFSKEEIITIVDAIEKFRAEDEAKKQEDIEKIDQSVQN